MRIKVSTSNFSTEVVFDGRVYRWASNGRVPPADAIRDYKIDQLPGFDKAAHDAERDAEITEALEAYRSYRENQGYSDEEMYEMSAAFGPGVMVVDVITGKRIGRTR